MEVPELVTALNEFMNLNHLSPLPQNDIAYLLNKFDVDGTGRIDFAEFKKMLKSLGGIRKYTSHSLRDKRNRRKHKQENNPGMNLWY